MVEHLEWLLAAGAAALVVLAELLHAVRIRRVARLAFGPSRRPAAWVALVPLVRAAAAGALVYGLTTLLTLPPKIHRVASLEEREPRHLLLILDVSPSMRLVDAGPDGVQSRRQRAADLLKSFFDRVAMEAYKVSVVAAYNGAKPVVIDTRDFEVVENVLRDLPMEFAFTSGKTRLFAGLEEAAKIARPWNPRSTIVVLVSDGDTVPAQGMPRMPASVQDVLIVGVGDTRTGKFIDGRHSRQDASTLRQIAVRLRGTYHDGNDKHIPTDVLRRLTGVPGESLWQKLSKREYALIATGLGGLLLALVPWLLHVFGTRWKPGVRARRTRRERRHDAA